jgi:phytanoyl-CoA hydroxylase
VIPRFSPESDSGAMRLAFDRDGLLIVEDAIHPDDCDTLIARAHAIVEAWDPEQGRAVFSTTAPKHAADAYFRESGDRVRVFLEDGAVDADGALSVDRHRAVNKIGHAMHDQDPVFRRVSRAPILARVAALLSVEAPRLAQSMVIWKPPGIGGEVVPHQDATFLVTDPPSVLGFWLALEDADETNGCLLAIPGGHQGPLRQRFLECDGALTMTTLDETPFETDRFVALPARKGTLVVLHGLLPHGSAANRSDRSRMAYTLHVVDGAAVWHPGNWIRRRADDPFRGFA